MGVRSWPGRGSSARLRMYQATSAREMVFMVKRALAWTWPVSGPSVSLMGRSAYQSSVVAASSFSMACRSLPTRPRLGVMTVRKKRNSRRGPVPITVSAGPMLPVLTEISLLGVPRSLIALSHLAGQRSDRAPRQALLLKPRDETLEHRGQLRQGRNPAQRLGQPAQHLGAAVRYRRLYQLVPASEVVVELALARTGGHQHVIQTGSRNAALGDQFRSVVHDPLAAGAPALSSRLTWHAAMVAIQWTEQSRTGCSIQVPMSLPGTRTLAPSPAMADMRAGPWATVINSMLRQRRCGHGRLACTSTLVIPPGC